MPLLEYIDAIFPDTIGEMTLDQITQRLICRYSRAVNYHRVYRAVVALRSRASTAERVAPIRDSFPALYSPAAARRIARRVSARQKMPDADILRRSKLPGASELRALLDARETNSNRIETATQTGRKPGAKTPNSKRSLR